MTGGVSCDAGIQAHSVPFHFHNNQETPKKPSEQHQCPGSQPWKGDKISEFLQKPEERQFEVQLQGKHFSVKMEQDVPANQIRGDSITELTTQPTGRWGRTLLALQPGLQRSLLTAVL